MDQQWPATFYREQSAVIEHNNAILRYWCGTPAAQKTKDQTGPSFPPGPLPQHDVNIYAPNSVYEPTERILFDRHSTIPSSDKLGVMGTIFDPAKEYLREGPELIVCKFMNGFLTAQTGASSFYV